MRARESRNIVQDPPFGGVHGTQPAPYGPLSHGREAPRADGGRDPLIEQNLGGGA